MKTIGENIATLRKKQGITQEALASVIGVSTQAISKWENNTNMPDITLLPIISSIFGVTIDELFGKNSEKTYYSFAEVCDRANDAVLDVMGNAFYEGNETEPYDQYVKCYKNDLKKNNKLRTAVFKNGNIVYHRNDLGSILLKNPTDGWVSNLSTDKVQKVARIIGNGDFINLLKFVIKSKTFTFTVPSVCMKCDIKEPGRLVNTIIESGLFDSKTLEIADESVTVYEFKHSGKLHILYAVFALAYEFEEYQNIYFNYVGG